MSATARPMFGDGAWRGEKHSVAGGVARGAAGFPDERSGEATGERSGAGKTKRSGAG